MHKWGQTWSFFDMNSQKENLSPDLLNKDKIKEKGQPEGMWWGIRPSKRPQQDTPHPVKNLTSLTLALNDRPRVGINYVAVSPSFSLRSVPPTLSDQCAPWGNKADVACFHIPAASVARRGGFQIQPPPRLDQWHDFVLLSNSLNTSGDLVCLTWRQWRNADREELIIPIMDGFMHKYIGAPANMLAHLHVKEQE